MRRLGIAMMLSLAACAGTAEPTATPRAPVGIPGACIPPAGDEPTPIRDGSADGQRVSFCVGALADHCFAFDLQARTLDEIRERRRPSDDARVTVTNPDLQVCRGEACTVITSHVLPNAKKLAATTNSEGTFAVVLLGDAERGKGYAEVWDVPNGKRKTSFRYARGEFRCGEVRMVGDTIYLSASTCTGPSARAALYSLTGKKIANVGGKEFGSFGNAHVQLTGPTWAFLDENGHQLVVQDVRGGRIVKTIDTSGLWTEGGTPRAGAIGNPGEHALVRLGDGRLAVIAGTPANGRIAIVDATTGEVTIVRPPICGS